jgi:DNA-binding IscR family transcriptional regulator
LDTVAANSRLTISVHALAWLALAHRRGLERLTSDQVAASVNANPVILRTSLGRLREAGLVEVSHGSGAGWWLSRPPEQISLLDVYEAIGSDALFAMHHTEPNQECPVGRGIRPALDEVYADVDAAVRHALGRKSIAEVLDQSLVWSEQ